MPPLVWSLQAINIFWKVINKVCRHIYNFEAWDGCMWPKSLITRYKIIKFIIVKILRLEGEVYCRSCTYSTWYPYLVLIRMYVSTSAISSQSENIFDKFQTSAAAHTSSRTCYDWTSKSRWNVRILAPLIGWIRTAAVPLFTVKKAKYCCGWGKIIADCFA